MRSESGFTLIELLTIIGIIGVLSSLGLTSFQYYKAAGAYASAETTLHNARNALAAGTSDQDNLPATVALTTASSQGDLPAPLTPVFPGLKVGSSIKIRASYNPNCLLAACTNAYIQVNHCQGLEYTSYTRAGDGSEVVLRHVGGIGCP